MFEPPDQPPAASQLTLPLPPPPAAAPQVTTQLLHLFSCVDLDPVNPTGLAYFANAISGGKYWTLDTNQVSGRCGAAQKGPHCL